jgi:predicted RNase H-like nuclease (RuvC/YqgF family)
MRKYIVNLERKKKDLQNEIKKLNKIIIKLHKEKEEFKKNIKSKEEASYEYVQSKIVAN